jgi:valyl-tRNA synthetase
VLAEEFQFLARIDGAAYEQRAGRPEAPPSSLTIVAGDATIYLPLAGMVDLDAERARLSKELDEALAEVERANGMLSNEQFVSRAPANVVEVQRERLGQAEGRVGLLRARLAEIG